MGQFTSFLPFHSSSACVLVRARDDNVDCMISLQCRDILNVTVKLRCNATDSYQQFLQLYISTYLHNSMPCEYINI